MSKLKAYRLPIDLITQLSKLARQTHRSETHYVKEAIRLYLRDYADARIAKDRFNDPRSEVISGKELRKRLGV